MERVNAMRGMLPNADLKAADFLEQTHLPYRERNTKASTLHGYRKASSDCG